MKAIMISIKPEYVADILNGEKTIEIRKTMPKCDLPIDVYIYCTKEKTPLFKYIPLGDAPNMWDIDLPQNKKEYSDDVLLNGKVVAKFTLKKITPTNEFYEDEICSLACISKEELFNYLGMTDGYAWHIDNLQIFDKPKSLTWIRGTKQGIDFVGKPYFKFLKRPPQSYCYIEL